MTSNIIIEKYNSDIQFNQKKHPNGGPLALWLFTNWACLIIDFWQY